jgi:glyoxylate carboligase
MAEIEFDDDAYAPLPVYKPAVTRKQAEKAMAMLNAAERPLLIAGAHLHAYKPRNWINCGQAGPCRRRWACARPTRTAGSWRCPATTTSSS